MLELDGDFFGRKMECVGAGISGGGHHGPTRQGGAPWTLVARCQLLLLCSQCQIFSNILEKTYLNFRAFGELLFSGYFYIARINQITDEEYLFLFYLI